MKINSTFIKKWVLRRVFSYKVLSRRSGFIKFKATGKTAKQIFNNECGGHRWQRIPPTERKGRRQTSTITVAVLNDNKAESIEIKDSDLEIKTTKDSGPGGQKRNKTETAVQMLHKPSGLRVSICTNKSQTQNKKLAKKILKNKLQNQAISKNIRKKNKTRKSQIGTGMRGDKIRTIQVQRNQVINHFNNKKISFKAYQKGLVTKLH